MNVLPELPPVFLVLDDSDGVRRLVARAMDRLLPGAIVVEASCNREAVDILSSRKVSGMVEDFQRWGEDAIDLECTLMERHLQRPQVILYTGTDLSLIREAFQRRRLAMVDRFAAIVPKVDTDILCEQVVAVFAPRDGTPEAPLIRESINE